jgi:solute carrier family 39 (zinc transporter), member 1/2/3
MAEFGQIISIVARQADANDNETIQVPLIGTPGHCDTSNGYNGDMGARVSAIFVILVGSFFGKFLPLS